MMSMEGNLRRFSGDKAWQYVAPVARAVRSALPEWFLVVAFFVVFLTPMVSWAEDQGAPVRFKVGESEPEATSSETVPSWVADAVFYQIFPGRFRNGDAQNDPTRESLEFPENVSEDWKITPWTGDWYARADWEKERGEDFFEGGVFDRRYGGDLQGVIDRIDYLVELGINTIYLNPVFYAKSLHKYDGNSFHHIDPYFGPDPKGDFELMSTETSDPATWKWTEADKLFLQLVKQTHKHGMRLILDGVFNHTGRNFFAFEDLTQNQTTSPYRDWYIVQSFDDPKTAESEFTYKGWWGVMTLPEFANNRAGDDLHPGPKQYIMDATSRWMDPNGDGDPKDGIDGWRLDVAVEVPVGFWKDWNAHVRSLNPEAYTVAEHWEDAAKFLADGGFSATMNYHGFAWPVKGYLIDGTLSASDAGRMLQERMLEYPVATRYALQNLIDSHDTDRVASMIVNAKPSRPYLQPDRFDYDVGDRVSPRNSKTYSVRAPNAKERRIQRMIGVLQATFVGAPMLYYGTEAGMWGADDPCDRMPMVWPDLRYEDQATDPLGREYEPAKVQFDHAFYRFYRALFQLRNAHPALRRGDFEVVAAVDAAQGLIFRRSNEQETLWVVINRGDKPWTANITSGEPGAVHEVFTASGEPHNVTLKRQEKIVSVSLPALEVAVLRQEHSALAVDK